MNIEVTQDDFIEYHENLEMMYDINDVEVELTTEEILDSILEYELLIEAGIDAGIKVTDEEVLEYALQTKKAFEKDDFSEEGQKLEVILQKLAEELDVEVNNYFTHPETLENYKKELIAEKYIEKLYVEDILKENETIDVIYKELLEVHAEDVEINEKLLNELKELDDNQN